MNFVSLSIIIIQMLVKHVENMMRLEHRVREMMMMKTMTTTMM